MACDDEIMPLQERIETVGDDADMQEVCVTYSASPAPAPETICSSRLSIRGWSFLMAWGFDQVEAGTRRSFFDQQHNLLEIYAEI